MVVVATMISIIHMVMVVIPIDAVDLARTSDQILHQKHCFIYQFDLDSPGRTRAKFGERRWAPSHTVLYSMCWSFGDIFHTYFNICYTAIYKYDG